MLYLTQGREMAFNEIYRRYSGRIYWFFFQRIGQNRVKAEDFTQNLFIKLIENSESFKRNKCFKTWIYAIAYNMCKNEYRRIKSREGHLRLKKMDMPNLVDKDSANIGKFYDQELFSKRLRIELDKLSQKYSTTFILRHEHDLSIKSIAQIMSCPEGTVKSRLFFAIKQLSNRLKVFKSIKL
jgi:RNA polymerase sigma-70 factor (ECF subfamily)